MRILNCFYEQHPAGGGAVYFWKSDNSLQPERIAPHADDPLNWGRPIRVWIEFYGKLLALLVQHWLILVSAWQRLDRSLYHAAQVIRKHAFHLATVLMDDFALQQALRTSPRRLGTPVG